MFIIGIGLLVHIILMNAQGIGNPEDLGVESCRGTHTYIHTYIHVRFVSRFSKKQLMQHAACSMRQLKTMLSHT